MTTTTMATTATRSDPLLPGQSSSRTAESSNAEPRSTISGVIPGHQQQDYISPDAIAHGSVGASRRRSSIKTHGTHSPPETLTFGQDPPPIVASSSKSPQRRGSLATLGTQPTFQLNESSFAPPRDRQEPQPSSASNQASSWDRQGSSLDASHTPQPVRPEMLRFMSGLSASSANRRGLLSPSDQAYGEHKGYPFGTKRPDMITRDSQSSFSSRTGGDSPSTHPFHLELTTKGRKRKRLAKACSACHKNKRRCDGFAPCSNWYVVGR